MLDPAQLTGLTANFSVIAPIAASEFWLTKWLTPIWFLGTGVGLGLIAILIFALLVRLLSTIPFWESLSHSPAGHFVALVISVGLTALIGYYPLSAAGDGSSIYPAERFMLGLTLFLLCSIVGWSLVFCCSRQSAKNVFATLGEGAAGFIGIAALVVVFVGLISTVVVEDPRRAFTSFPDLFSTGSKVEKRVIEGNKDLPPDAAPFVAVDLPIAVDLLDSIEVKTNRSIVLADGPSSLEFRRAPKRLDPGESANWNRKQSTDDSPIPLGEEEQLYIQNREIDPADVEFTIVTRPAVPQSATFLLVGVAVFLIGLSILLQQAVAPRVSAVALATVKNELAQPLFLVLLLLGFLSIVLFVFLPFNTFGEDIKLLKDCGITTIMLLAAFQGIWSASSSISEEIEGRTALTVLSKPIQRRSFIIGKFLGVFWLLFLMFVVLGACELAAVAFKPIYDARESSVTDLVWQTCHAEMMSTLPGLAMAFMQAVVLSAISVALATRLPQLANLSVCFAIYVVGNLTTSLVSSTQEGFEIVRFVAQLVATIIPILEHFSMQAAIDSGNQITLSLLSGSLIYCLLYVLLSMFLALLLFEDRDLA
jgi:ABC-type transport system involved in multi-copper enzyme maturation permease subunit